LKERDKYELVWTYPEYRKHSPAEGRAEEIFREARERKAKTVVDYGCGTGRLSLILAERGFDVIPVDHAVNCLDEAVEERLGHKFVQGCLWEIEVEGDFGVCVDVLEHIPEWRVDGVLSKMRVEHGYFQIATNRDGFGPKLIGEHLHLTVRPMDWWMEKVKRYFPEAVCKGRVVTF
jgi:SAM-dependent methyltransferase